MKKAILLLAAVSVLALQACTSTGNIGADARSLWNSPSVQSALTAIEQAAISFATSFVTSHLGGTTRMKVSSPSVQAAIDNAVSKIQRQHPDVPESVIRDIVKAKFAEKL